MSTDQKLATWLCANKLRAEKLFRLTQVNTPEATAKAKIVTSDILASFLETFGFDLHLEP